MQVLCAHPVATGIRLKVLTGSLYNICVGQHARSMSIGLIMSNCSINEIRYIVANVAMRLVSCQVVEFK